MSTYHLCDRCDAALGEEPPSGITLAVYQKDGAVLDTTDYDLCKPCYADAVDFMKGGEAALSSVTPRKASKKLSNLGEAILACKKHRLYTGKYRPRTKCVACNARYRALHDDAGRPGVEEGK